MRKFFKTVAIVTVFSISEKTLGFIYRIFLSHSIGSIGVGIYQASLSIFGFILTIICSGTPITVSRLMTKYRAENRIDKVDRVVSSGLFLTLITSLIVALIIILFPSFFSFLFTNDTSMRIFIILTPALIFTSIYSVLRGVFWGNKDFMPYSIIELLEEICMILMGILLIHFTSNELDGAVCAGIAVLISFIFSFTCGTIVFFIRKNKLVNPFKELKPLVFSATPVTAMRVVNSLSASLISIILPVRLMASGYTNSQAMSLYGSSMGQAMPLLFIPTSLIGAFTLVLIPEISENYYGKKYYYLKRDVEKSIKFTTLLSCIFIPLFTVLGEEIGVLVFNSYECGKYLSSSAFLMLFMGLSSITTSILNSIGKEKLTLLFSTISGILMLISIWVLPKFLGVYSLVVGFLFIYGLTTILNFVLLNKNCNKKPKVIKYILLSALFVLPTILFGLMLEKMLLPLLGVTLTFFLCGIIMTVFICLLYFAFDLINIKIIIDNLPNKLKIFRNKKPLTK